MSLSFTAFGERVDLTLEKNKNLLTPNFEVWKRDENNILSKVHDWANGPLCHYLHEDSLSSAAVSLCDAGAVVSLLEYQIQNNLCFLTPSVLHGMYICIP